MTTNKTKLGSLAWPLAPQFVLPLRVQEGDIDDFRHVNNVVYLGWMARCAWAHSKALGFDFATFEKHDCGFVVTRHEIDYRAAALPDEQIEVATWIVENDARLRLSRRFLIRSVNRDMQLARGVTRFAAMRLSTNKAMRMVDAYKHGYLVDAAAADYFGPLD
jgi:acyl-CoA thioester hydrolase